MGLGHVTVESRVWPTFFIVGAAKSGTTTLWAWLRDHPDVFFPQKKEPLFFCGFSKKFGGPGADLINRMVVWDAEEYAALFRDSGGYAHRGEASTDYLTCPSAPARIHEVAPAAKIIILLRDPVERAFSEHLHLVRDGWETRSFEESIELEEERTGENWNTLFRHVFRSTYAPGVERYRRLFPPGNVFVALYDDLVRDPRTLLGQILDFLDLDPLEVDYQSRHNRSGTVRSEFLRRVIRGAALPRWVRRAGKRLLGAAGVSRAQLALTNMNLKPRPGLDPATRKKLQPLFRDDMLRLEEALGRSLDGWLE